MLTQQSSFLRSEAFYENILITLKDTEQWNERNNVKNIGALSAECVCWEPFCVDSPGWKQEKGQHKKSITPIPDPH